MSTVYIHIGMPKTGTTAIQDFLAANRKNLKKQNAVYPDFHLNYEWVSKTRNAFWLTNRGFDEKEAEACFAEINRLSEQWDKIILSDEVLWNGRGFSSEFWNMVRDNLREEIDIKMIAYIRRQDQYMYSWWAQQVKAHQPMDFKTLSFHEFLESETYKNLKRHLDYRAYFQAGVNVLGKENVLVRIFERGQFAGGSIYSDFLDAVGMRPDDAFQVPENLTNISIRGSVLEAKRYLNRIPEFSQKEYHLLPYLESVQKQMESEGSLAVRNDFTRQERTEFLKKYETSNEWTAKNLLGREDGVLFLEPVSEDRGEPGDYTAGEVAEVCGYLMLDMMRQINEQKKEISRLKKKKPLNQPLPDKKQTVRRMLKKLRMSE